MSDRNQDSTIWGVPERLVLDAGSVLIPSVMPTIVRELSRVSGVGEGEMWEHFHRDLHDGFWGGGVDLDAFWRSMLARAGLPAESQPDWEARIPGWLTPLPAVSRLGAWRERVPISVVSNQRHEWALPVLERHGVVRTVDHLLISSQTGRVKPYPEALEQVTALASAPERVLYLDDRADVLRQAHRAGARVMRADGAGRWIGRVDRILSGRGPRGGGPGSPERRARAQRGPRRG